MLIVQVLYVVGILQDEVDPMVSIMKSEKALLESYAHIGGLDAQIQEIKEAVEPPLTHPELYEDIGIRPPKGVNTLWRDWKWENIACKGSAYLTIVYVKTSAVLDPAPSGITSTTQAKPSRDIAFPPHLFSIRLP